MADERLHSLDALPVFLFDEDLCRVLCISLRTLKRLRTNGALPIAELPSLDRKHRYARRDVEAYLNRETVGRLATVRRRV